MSRKNRFTSVFAAALLTFFTYACSQGQQSTDPSAPESSSSAAGTTMDAAAKVNGQSIPMSELRVAVLNVIRQNNMDAGQIDSFMDQFGPRILNQLIDGELLFQAAQKEDQVVGKEEVEAAFAELSDRYNTPDEFNAEMEARGFTESTLKASIIKQMSIQKLIQETIVPEAEVPEESVKEAYDQNPQNFIQQEEVKASHILIKSAEGDPQEKKDDALKRAREIAADARKDDADFAELARKHSEGPSAPSGGDLGFFTRGRMVKPFEETAFSMKLNEISDPVLTQFGYHIIKITDRKEAKTRSFEEVRDQLYQDLKNRMINQMIGQKLSQMREKATIEVLFRPAMQTEPGGSPQDQTLK